MHSTMFEIRLERTVCLAALCVFLAWGCSSPSKTVEPTDVADDGAAEDIFGDIRSGDGSTDTGPVLERCEPGTYIEAKDGQCYLCNLEGDGVAGRGAEMDDLNPCTEDFCDPVDGVTHEFNSAPCDDGSPDTINDTCVDGVCTGEALVCTAAEYYESEGTCLLCNAAGTGPDGEGDAIDDDDVCTDDVCNDASGVAHTFNNEPCDDGDSETTNDVCIEGVCSGTPVTCEAGTQYEVDGKCYLCNDNGTGSVGTGKNLDDGNPCTDDVCHVEDGVVHPFNSAPCDDGNPGTIEDTCEQGLCVGTTMPCQPALHYKSGPLCKLCNDDGSGSVGEGALIDDDDVCTDDICSPAAGVTHYFNQSACDDGDDETINDTCNQGVCAGTAVTCAANDYFAADGHCHLCNGDGTGTVGESETINDGNPCTDDSCDSGLGVQHLFNSVPCNDGDPGTTGDVCDQGQCTGTPITCPAGEWFEEGSKCQQCNGSGTGTLGAGEKISDGNPCTDDVCDAGLGVKHYPNAIPCDDGDADTVDDNCVEGQCVGTPVTCPAGDHYKVGPDCLLCNGDGTGPMGAGDVISDGNVCTDDFCNPGLGVVHYNNGNACDDGNAQTLYDHCEEGGCEGVPIACPAGDWFEADGLCHHCNGDGTATLGEGVTINDGNICTDDACDSGNGVEHFFNEVPCNDGDPDTLYDHCDEGQCKGTPIACPAGDYYISESLCYLCNNDGTGPSGNGAVVDDGNLCTDDFCSPGVGVVHYNNDSQCDDGNPDSIGDVCDGGICQGVIIACPAGDHYPAGGLCLLCNGDGTGPVGDGETIDDGNLCTDDLCDAGLGVQHWVNGNDCEDGDPETVQDKCVNGQCKGKAVTCDAGDYFAAGGLCYLCNGDGTGTLGEGSTIDDGNLCTDDNCDPGNGVEHDHNWVPCDDGDDDTLYDTCEDGICSGVHITCPAGDYFEVDELCYLCNGNGTGPTDAGTVIDDGEVCTDDVCDPGWGAYHHNTSAPCDDGDPETDYDHCSEGECVGIPILCPVGDYYVDEVDGLCYLCDGDGSGPIGVGAVIDDGDACTEDACDPGGGVEHYELWNTPCDDGNADTLFDYCDAGICVGLEAMCPAGKWVADGPWWCSQCDEQGTGWVDDGHPTSDSEDCTDDFCDPDDGVVHLPREGECWDNNKCTFNDVCVNAVCTGTPFNCDDGNECTEDTCLPEWGCAYDVVPEAVCDDGIDLTPDDVCIDGLCVGWLDPDGDGVPNYGTGPKCDPPAVTIDCVDNCPYRSNVGQQDSDHDGLGNSCEKARWWCRIPTDEKVVALTFDDGWSHEDFQNIVDVLNEKDAYGSFFLVGEFTDDGVIPPWAMVKARNGGHQFGNHTYHHVPGESLNESISEILLADEFWMGIFGESVRPLFRQPYATIVPWINIALEATGYTESVLGNFDSSDWLEPEPAPQDLADCIVDQAEPGDIIGFHVGPPVTAKALPLIIDGLHAKGFEMLTLEQMIAFGEPEIITIDEVKTCYFLFTGEDWGP